MHHAPARSGRPSLLWCGRHRITLEFARDPNVTENHLTVDQLLSDARSKLARLGPGEAAGAIERGALLVDIRSESQVAADGAIPGARWVARNVLEWRLDPASPHRDPELARRELPVILICNEGDQSSLAAAMVRRLGVDATDVVGGFQAWRAAGLPVSR
ncbi:MAG: rhodanese-like domain-containing protein [Solirubrobacterales bacterium]